MTIGYCQHTGNENFGTTARMHTVDHIQRVEPGQTAKWYTLRLMRVD